MALGRARGVNRQKTNLPHELLGLSESEDFCGGSLLSFVSLSKGTARDV